MALFGNGGILSGLFDGTPNPDGTTGYLGGLLTYDPKTDVGRGDRLGLFGASLKDAAAQFSGHPEAANNLDRYSALRRKQEGQNLLAEILAGQGGRLGGNAPSEPPTPLPSPMQGGLPMMVDRTLPQLPGDDDGGHSQAYDLKRLAPKLALAAAAGVDVGPVLDVIKMSQPKYSTAPQFAADGRGYLVGDDGTLNWLDPSVTQPHKMQIAPNGQVYDPLSVRPGTSFNDPNKAFGVGADGQAVPNALYQGYDAGKVRAQQAPQWARLDLERSKTAVDPKAVDLGVQYFMQYGRLPPTARNPAMQGAIMSAASDRLAAQGHTMEDVVHTAQTNQGGGKAVSAFMTGKQGDTVRSLNVAVSHLESLRELGHALENGNPTFVNSARQKFAEAFGVPAPTNWDAAKSIVADEIAKSVVGGPSAQADREALAATLKRSSSPAQVEGVIGTFQDLLGGQLRGLRQQYKSSTGRDDFNSKLFPHTLSVLDRHDQMVKANGGALPAQARSALKEGVVTTFGNGQRWTLQAGKPERVQ